LIGGRFDGADVVFYGKPPSLMILEANDRVSSKDGTQYHYSHAYEYSEVSSKNRKVYIEYAFNCTAEYEKVEDVVE
jgi:hypothetical protein